MSSFNEYQEKVTKIKKYPKGKESLYLLAKLTEESGEVAKELRRKEDGEEMQKDLTLELGDVLWVITAIAEENNITLEEVLDRNLEKLKERNLL